MPLRGVQGASFISLLANQTDFTEKVVRDGYCRASESALSKKNSPGGNPELTLMVTAALKRNKQYGFSSVLSHCVFA